MEQLARRPRWPWASLPAEVEMAAETSPVVRSALLAAKNKLDLATSR
jgi:hypothetical protein